MIGAEPGSADGRLRHRSPATSGSVAVVGAGVVGLSVADALLADGWAVTTVAPPPSPDRPLASRAAGAMLGAFGESTVQDEAGADPAFGFRLRAQRAYPAWLERIEDRSGRSVHQVKGTFVVANAVGADDRANVKLMQRRAEGAGEPWAWVEPDEVPGLGPARPDRPSLCLYLAAEHAVDSDQLLDAMEVALATERRWTRITETAKSAAPDGQGWRVTTTTGSSIRVDQLVLAAGSRSWEVLGPGLEAEAGLPELAFGKGVACVVRDLPGPALTATLRTPNRAFACGIHLVPRGDGSVYVGATNCVGTDHRDALGIQPGEVHNLFDEAIHQLRADLREARIVEFRVGFRPVVRHGQPILGRTGLPGLAVATGTYRDGMLMAPVMGEVVAAELRGEDDVGNPFPVSFSPEGTDVGSVIDDGVRDIVSFLQEPRGMLPYDRAGQLERSLASLFRLATAEGDRADEERRALRVTLARSSMSETMHRVFVELADPERDPRPPPGAGR